MTLLAQLEAYFACKSVKKPKQSATEVPSLQIAIKVVLEVSQEKIKKQTRDRFPYDGGHFSQQHFTLLYKFRQINNFFWVSIL